MRGVGKGKDMERVGGNDVNFNNKYIGGTQKSGAPGYIANTLIKLCHIHCYGVHDIILFRKDKAEDARK